MVQTVSVKPVRIVQNVAWLKPAVVGNALLAMIVVDSHVGQMMTAEVSIYIVAKEHVVFTIATPTTLFGSLLV